MRKLIALILFCVATIASQAQLTVRGNVTGADDGEPLIGASVVVKGTTIGTTVDWQGNFAVMVDIEGPIILEVTYVGYQMKEVEVTSTGKLNIQLEEDVSILEAVEITGRRISEKKQESPLTVESLDLIAIKETPAANFYDGLGALKDVDLTSASLGFKIINTRGFNSTSPVRSLQVIDGVDNQSPGLNFSLGNFLGSSELDIQKVDIVVGASSSYYGPGAFNGVISMQTKDPFIHSGLSGMVKYGERNLTEVALRYADILQNKSGDDAFAFKLNFSYLSADDWRAENYTQVYDTDTPPNNPGGFDAVNIYGDEYYNLADVTTSDNWYFQDPGLGEFHRTGYREIDLVNYDTRNFKGNAALHLRLNPEMDFESPELVLSSSIGGGTTVYQGDNRFSLRDILFFQHRLELRKKDKYFVRAYWTHEDAGDSYDPYFTALQLQELAKDNETWAFDYRRFWKNVARYPQQMRELGYPELMVEFNPETNMFDISFDREAAIEWLDENNALLTEWHQLAEDFANQESSFEPGTQARLEPGTPEFERAFNNIIGTLSSNRRNGTKFYSQSELYHVHGEYRFDVDGLDDLRFGGNWRQYAPDTRGTIFNDSTAENEIRLNEFGVYGGITKKFIQNKLTANVTLRGDKNQNLDFIFTPSASLVYKPKENNYLRLSFASALRNPTLSDQYLSLNVGPAILAGQVNGVDSLITLESFFDNPGRPSNFEYFDIDPIKPERVRTVEIGYRTILFDKLYLDASAYNSIYNNFLGFLIGVDADVNFDDPLSLPENVQVYRYAANSDERVITRGFSFGLNYYFKEYFVFNGNYSFNRLIETDEDDPIIPAFNTPEHKFNLGLSARDLPIRNSFADTWGFSINYKYVDGFLFEGSPQFTGFIEYYGLLDAQVNIDIKKIHTTVKLGASNILNNEHYETYGGPLIGRLAYVSAIYEFNKMN